MFFLFSSLYLLLAKFRHKYDQILNDFLQADVKLYIYNNTLNRPLVLNSYRYLSCVSHLSPRYSHLFNIIVDAGLLFVHFRNKNSIHFNEIK